jgi:uncharacterized protein with WD repeat
VHLTPNGKGVVVEHYEWITPPQSLTGEKLERAKTGELAVYDADTGTLMNKIALRPAPGISGRLVNFSEDGRFLYYTSHEHMYVVDLTAAQVASTFALPAGFTPIAVLPVNP